MSKVYKIYGNETGYEYNMTFYDDTVEIGYRYKVAGQNGPHFAYSTLYGFSVVIKDEYELYAIREDFADDMLDGISQCGSLEEAKDLALIAFEAEGLFDYVFENWGCPDCEY